MKLVMEVKIYLFVPRCCFGQLYIRIDLDKLTHFQNNGLNAIDIALYECKDQYEVKVQTPCEATEVGLGG